MIPVNEPLLGDREKILLEQCIDTGWVSADGPFVREFEERFAAFVGCRHGVAVANGTVALELAVRVLELPAGAEVIVPTFTIVSCLLALLRNDLRPVLVDADPGTWCLDVAKTQWLLEHRPAVRAIMAVHIYGHPCDMTALRRLAHHYDLAIIEDAAEAHGARCRLDSDDGVRWYRCGALGDIGVFSFYANKILTTGEGGMLVINDDQLAERARRLRNLAFQPNQRFVHAELGYNFRMSNLQAAIGVAQLERFAALLERKKAQARRYREQLAGLPGICLQQVKDWADPVYWVNGIVLDESVPMDASVLAERLGDAGIQTRPFFWPMHEQPVFARMGHWADGHHPVAERLARRGLYLPSGTALTDGQIDRVCQELKRIVHG